MTTRTGLQQSIRDRAAGSGLGQGDRLRLAGVGAVSSAMLVFGVNNVVVGAMSISGLATAVYRIWLGTVALAVLLLLTGRRPNAAVLRAAIPAGVAYGLHICLMFSAFQTTSIANATVILSLQTGLTLTVVGRLFGESVRLPDVALTLVATVGVVLVVLGGSAGGTGSFAGDALAAAGTVGVTAYFVLAKRARLGVHAPAGEFQLSLLVVAAVATAPVFLVLGDGMPVPTGWDWVGMVALVGGGTAAHLGVNWAHRHVPLKVTSLLTLSVPVLSTTVAWVALDQRLSALQVLGAVVTLAALAVVILRAVSPEVPDLPE